MACPIPPLPPRYVVARRKDVRHVLLARETHLWLKGADNILNLALGWGCAYARVALATELEPQRLLGDQVIFEHTLPWHCENRALTTSAPSSISIPCIPCIPYGRGAGVCVCACVCASRRGGVLGNAPSTHWPVSSESCIFQEVPQLRHWLSFKSMSLWPPW